MDCRPPGFSVHGILQATILERVAVPFSRGSSQPRDQTQVSCILADSLLSEPPGKPKGPVEGQPVLTCFGFSSRFLPAVEEAGGCEWLTERPA